MSNQPTTYIGIDGGGTKTSAVMTNEKGEVLTQAIGAPTNFSVAKTTQICDEIESLVSKLLEKNKSRLKPELLSVCLSGLGRETEQLQLHNALANRALANHLFAGHDALAALEGAFPNEAGIIIIAGTGSIAFGKDRNANLFRCGGWGYLIGDEGSGFSIGRAGLNAALKDWDRRGERTVLRNLFENQLGVPSIEHAIPILYSKHANRGEIAKFALTVFEAAHAGDPVAKQIIDDTAAHLAALVPALCEHMQITGHVSVALIGNIFKQEELIVKKLKTKWQHQKTYVDLKQPQSPPEIGAIIAGLRKTTPEQLTIFLSKND